MTNNLPQDILSLVQESWGTVCDYISKPAWSAGFIEGEGLTSHLEVLQNFLDGKYEQPYFVAVSISHIIANLSPTNRLYDLRPRELQWLVTQAILKLDDDELISVSEAAATLGVSIATLSARIQAGRYTATIDPNESNPRRATRLFKSDFSFCRECGMPLVYVHGKQVCPMCWIDSGLIGTKITGATDEYPRSLIVTTDAEQTGHLRVEGTLFDGLKADEQTPPVSKVEIDFADYPPFPWWVAGRYEDTARSRVTPQDFGLITLTFTNDKTLLDDPEQEQWDDVTFDIDFDIAAIRQLMEELAE